jgi:hypothetical protein
MREIAESVNVLMFDFFYFFISYSDLFRRLFELNREPCENRGRARRCNRGRKLQDVTVHFGMGRRSR